MPTSGAHEGGLHSFAAVPTAGLVEGHTLLPCARHHLGILQRRPHATGGLHPQDLPRVGVRHVQRLADRVRRQVVLVGRAVAMETEDTGSGHTQVTLGSIIY